MGTYRQTHRFSDSLLFHRTKILQIGVGRDGIAFAVSMIEESAFAPQMTLVVELIRH
jgi:hypothetical protein